MKRDIIVCALLAAATVGGSGVWAGSGDIFDQPVRDKACCCPEQEDRMPPPLTPEKQIDHLTRQLGLTGEQQTKLRALFRRGQGPQPMSGDDRGPGHRPPPPCEDHRKHNPDGGYDGEQQ
jgi:hypothetical protein